MAEALRLLILGAHPDDAEHCAGGLATLYRQQGHVVRMVSLTNGAAGHQSMPPVELAQVRRREATAAANVIGATYDVWEYPDGGLLPTLDVRERVIREIRSFRPDLVLTHRTNDYHPDHRAAGQAVQDASYLVRVPLVAADAPPLQRDPVVAFMSDLFTKPNPLTADVVVDVTPVVDTVVAMLACHRSQVFDWLPWIEGVLDQVPGDQSERLPWLRGWYAKEAGPRADRYRKEFIAAYGAERGGEITFAEVFEISEYGSPLDAAARKRLFGFLA